MQAAAFKVKIMEAFMMEEFLNIETLNCVSMCND